MEVMMAEDNGKSIFGCGLLMGLADAVPGVSGGTIALILGIYNKLLMHISNSVMYFRLGFSSDYLLKFQKAFSFLFPLALGMLLSYYVVTKILVGSDSSPGLLLVKHTAPYVYSFFFGLVLANLKEPWKDISNPSRVNYSLIFIGAAIVFVYTRYPIQNSSTLFLILSGSLALTAMLLPGISGALVLLTLGLYDDIVRYVHNLEIIPLFYFFLGGSISLVTFVPFMNRMLENYRDLTMSILTGLMLGSLITLWPWKVNYDKGILPQNLPLEQITEEFNTISILFTAIFFILGILSTYGLHFLEQKLNT